MLLSLYMSISLYKFKININIVNTYSKIDFNDN